MPKSKLISIIIGLTIVAGAYLYLSKGNGSEQKLAGFPFASWFGGEEEDAVSPESDGWPQTDSQNPAAPSSDDFSDFTAYAHPELPFSFAYPNDMALSAFEGQAGAEILLFSGGGNEFQISIRPFDEPGPLTEERLHRDLPTIYIEQPQQVLIGPDKNIPAIIFFTEDPAAGKTREVWFVHGGYMYQVSAYAEFDPTLARMMGTWRFYE